MRRHLTPWRAIGAIAVLLLATVLILVRIPSGQYLLLPDIAHPVAPLVKVEGAHTPKSAGSVYFLDVIEKRAYFPFYMHRTGHWLGLDVHDAGEYKRDGEWRPLVPGMTLTVEPGCYIRPGPGVPDAFAGIGVRIDIRDIRNVVTALLHPKGKWELPEQEFA